MPQVWADRSPEYKARKYIRQREYRKTIKGKTQRAKYTWSPKRKAKRAEWLSRPEVKERDRIRQCIARAKLPPKPPRILLTKEEKKTRHKAYLKTPKGRETTQRGRRAYRKRACANLTYGYLRHRYGQLPNELLDVIRIRIQIKRYIKENAK